MRLIGRIRLILARPFFFIADRFTDGVSHYTDLGDWFYHTGEAVVYHQFRVRIVRYTKVCPKCGNEQLCVQTGFYRGTSFSGMDITERFLTCSNCANVGMIYCIHTKIRDKTDCWPAKSKYPIGAYRSIYARYKHNVVKDQTKAVERLGRFFFLAKSYARNVVNRFAPPLLILSKVCPSCKDEQLITQTAFPKTNGYVGVGLNEDFLVCSKCNHNRLQLRIVTKVKDEADKSKHPIASYLWMKEER